MLNVSEKRREKIERANGLIGKCKDREINYRIDDIENGEYGYLLSENGENEYEYEYVALNEYLNPINKQPRNVQQWIEAHDFNDLWRRSFQIVYAELEFYLEDDKIKEFLATLNEDEQRLLDFAFTLDKNGFWVYWPVSDIYMLPVPIDEIE